MQTVLGRHTDEGVQAKAHRFRTGLVALSVSLGIIIAPIVATPALAAGCTIYTNIDVGTSGAIGPNGTVWWRVRGLFTKPAPGCHDIQFRKYHDTNGINGDSGGILLKVHNTDGTITWIGPLVLREDDQSDTWKIIQTNAPTGEQFELYANGSSDGPYRVDMMF